MGFLAVPAEVMEKHLKGLLSKKSLDILGKIYYSYLCPKGK